MPKLLIRVVHFSSGESISINSHKNRSISTEKESSKGNSQLLTSALDRNIPLDPDYLIDRISNDPDSALRLFGKDFIELLCNEKGEYVKGNAGIPEFREELKRRIKEKIECLKEDDLLDKNGKFTDKAFDLVLSAVYLESESYIKNNSLFMEGKKESRSHYGVRSGIRNFLKGDRYRDIALKGSIRRAIRRGHTTLGIDDLRSFERKSKPSINIIYCIDSSASMKGRRLDIAKKAGLALAYKAILNRDGVGMISFSHKIKDVIDITHERDFLIKEMSRIRASGETNFSSAIEKGTDMLDGSFGEKHIVMLSDAMPTYGDDPVGDSMNSLKRARDEGITFSLIGVGLDEEGKKTAEEMINMVKGKLYLVEDAEDAGRVIIKDYYDI